VLAVAVIGVGVGAGAAAGRKDDVVSGALTTPLMAGSVECVDAVVGHVAYRADDCNPGMRREESPHMMRKGRASDVEEIQLRKHALPDGRATAMWSQRKNVAIDEGG